MGILFLRAGTCLPYRVVGKEKIVPAGAGIGTSDGEAKGAIRVWHGSACSQTRRVPSLIGIV